MLRTLTAFCFVFMCICTQLWSQSPGSPVHFEPKLGTNFHGINLEDASVSAMSQLGWNLGVDITYGVRWQLKSGIHVSKLRTDIVQESESQVSSTQLGATQLKLPVGLNYRLCHVDYFGLALFAQAVPSLRLSWLYPVVHVNYPRGVFSSRFGTSLNLARFIVELYYERGLTDFVQDRYLGKSHLVGLNLGIQL